MSEQDPVALEVVGSDHIVRKGIALWDGNERERLSTIYAESRASPSMSGVPYSVFVSNPADGSLYGTTRRVG